MWCCGVVGIVMFYPMLWMFGASLKESNNEIYSTISFIPKNPSFQAYFDAWNATGVPFGDFMINTYLMVLPKVVGIVISTVITSYGFSRFEFVGKKALFALLMSTLFLPQVVFEHSPVPDVYGYGLGGQLQTAGGARLLCQ